MPRFLQPLKSAFITGLLIVLPAWLAVLLLLKVLVQLGVLVKPVSSHLPAGVDHPQIATILVFLLFCLLVGTLVHTRVGRLLGKALSENVFAHVPGYQPLRGIAKQFAGFDSAEGFKPALIEVEDGCLAPAFLIESHANGWSTVFMPSVPTPMAGSIFIMPGGRVHPLDIPVAAMIRCISKWGSGSAEILAAHENRQQPSVPSPIGPTENQPQNLTES